LVAGRSIGLERCSTFRSRSACCPRDTSGATPRTTAWPGCLSGSSGGSSWPSSACSVLRGGSGAWSPERVSGSCRGCWSATFDTPPSVAFGLPPGQRCWPGGQLRVRSGALPLAKYESRPA
jgi:hypothetical protein